MLCKQLVQHWIHEFVIAKLFLQVSEQECYNHLPNKYKIQSIEIKLREK
jgi:hypothetical protein